MTVSPALPIFPVLLHELFYSFSGTLILGLVLLILPGLILSAWAVRVSRRSGGRSLAMQAGIAIGVLAVVTVVLRTGDVTLLCAAVSAGIAATAAVTHRLAPRITEMPSPPARSRPFDPPRRTSVAPALIGGAVFAVAAVSAYAAIVTIVVARRH